MAFTITDDRAYEVQKKLRKKKIKLFIKCLKNCIGKKLGLIKPKNKKEI